MDYNKQGRLYIEKAIKNSKKVTIKLITGESVVGVPSWGTNKMRICIRSENETVWIPVSDVIRVYWLDSLTQKNNPTD
ncbi:hypothetical protein [Paenibacillus sp. SN-8-1]|uniref:hypothetical protein n=1 Tax=Paenibacillus sp. SN-8-1 TaxID=3435409 RepID=UPI003D9A4327